MNFKKLKEDSIGDLQSSDSKKFKSDNFDESELKQLESDASNLLNSVGAYGMSMNRDLGQLKELLTKNVNDRSKDRRNVREGNGRRLLASERFNHGLVENQLMNLKQDLNIGAKDTSRRIYRVKRERPYYEPDINEFKNLVEKLKKRGTQYEFDFIGREDKRQSDHNMYMGIWADIQDEFRKFEGKHKMDFDSFITEDISQKVPIISKNVPKDLRNIDASPSPFSNSYDISHSSRHDSNTKSLLDGYFKIIQKFLEDAIFVKGFDIQMREEFYQFEKSFHNMDDSFENIWDIICQVFDNIDYKTVECLYENPNELQRRLCRNTCTWFEKEFWDEMHLNDVICQFVSQTEGDNSNVNMTDKSQDKSDYDQMIMTGQYNISEELITAIIDRILNYMKDFKYETDESSLELEDGKLPIYAIIYFCIRAGKRKEALQIAYKSSLPDVKIIRNLLEEELFYFEGSGGVRELTDNEKLYNTALEALSSISKRQSEDEQMNSIYKKDVFKEALLVLLTKHVMPCHELLNTNLSDYLWFNLQKCYFERPGMEFNKHNQDVLTLRILQSSIVRHGEEYFNEDGNNPLNFYKVLILVGLYEEAVRYLDSVDKHRIENTHVALVLNEIGIIGWEQPIDNDVMESFSMSKSRSKKDKKEKKPLLPLIIKNFCNFLGPDYFSQNVIYSTLLESQHCVRQISDLIVKHNSFSILLETSNKTNLNLISHKDLALAKFVPKATLSKIIHKVCTKVTRSTDDPHICILLQNKIGNDAEVVELILKKQNQLIQTKKDVIVLIASQNIYPKEALMDKGKKTIPNMSSEYKPIVDKIRNKAFKGSPEHKEYQRRFENMSEIVEFMNLVTEEQFDKAFSHMNKCQFLPLRDKIEPDIASFQPEILTNMLEVILLALVVLEKRIRQAKSKNMSSISSMFQTDEGKDIENLRNWKLDLKIFSMKVHKALMTKMDRSSPENSKKVESQKMILQKIYALTTFKHD